MMIMIMKTRSSRETVDAVCERCVGHSTCLSLKNIDAFLGSLCEI